MNLNLILEEVKNPQTDPYRLTEIFANYNQAEIKALLASNPQTPWQILVKLEDDYTQKILTNPALYLYLYRRTDFLKKIPESDLISLIKYPKFSPVFIIYCLDNCMSKEVIINILSHHGAICNQWRCADPITYIQDDYFDDLMLDIIEEALSIKNQNNPTGDFT
jgi:hypothetical protein